MSVACSLTTIESTTDAHRNGMGSGRSKCVRVSKAQSSNEQTHERIRGGTQEFPGHPPGDSHTSATLAPRALAAGGLVAGGGVRLYTIVCCCAAGIKTRISACSMENDFVDVFPSAGGVGDSPVKGLPGSSSSRPALSLSIPGLESGGREALVSPAVTEGMGKEFLLHSARAMSEASEAGVAREDDVVMLDTPSESPARCVGLMPLTIEAVGGECVPTELEKKRAKLEKYRYECSEVGGWRFQCFRVAWVRRGVWSIIF